MTSYISRLGRTIEADEVFHAWTSGSIARMRAALDIGTNPIDRHFLLLNLFGAAYRKRSVPAMRKLCREIGRQHVTEFSQLAPALQADFNGVLPRVPTFVQLAILLADDGDVDEAINVCRMALRHGLHDGTKAGYLGRIERLQKRR